MSQSPDTRVAVKPTIFREYIGAKDIIPINIDDFPGYMINDNIPEFHFLLGFAIETYVNGKGTGLFSWTWNIIFFSPTNVAKLKRKHKNVKVIISIGGHGYGYSFDPIDNDTWIKNATLSIKNIILFYNAISTDVNIIDGIDISYEFIHSNPEDFSSCIGKVIKQLKEDLAVSKSMKIVSIAPTDLLQSHYLKLYRDNKANIDWIDYKFYNQYFLTKDEFVDLFNQLVCDYDTAHKLLAGVSTEMSNPTIFVEGCKFLINRSSLAGVFVWDANASAPTYSLEGYLQKLLINK